MTKQKFIWIMAYVNVILLAVLLGVCHAGTMVRSDNSEVVRTYPSTYMVPSGEPLADIRLPEKADKVIADEYRMPTYGYAQSHVTTRKALRPRRIG
jgi:hypothetical protein